MAQGVFHIWQYEPSSEAHYFARDNERRRLSFDTYEDAEKKARDLARRHPKRHDQHGYSFVIVTVHAVVQCYTEIPPPEPIERVEVNRYDDVNRLPE